MRVVATCGTTISRSTRSRPAPRFRAASMVERSSEAMAPATRSAANGVCFHTKVMTIPRQSRKLVVVKGSRTPAPTSMLFIIPFLARKVRMSWPATTKGMKSGQR